MVLMRGHIIFEFKKYGLSNYPCIPYLEHCVEPNQTAPQVIDLASYGHFENKIYIYVLYPNKYSKIFFLIYCLAWNFLIGP